MNALQRSDFDCRFASERTNFEAVVVVQPKRQRNPDLARSGRDMIGHALREPGPDECGSDGTSHAQRLRYVDMPRKGKVYRLCDDDAGWSLHSVDMVSTPYPNHLRAWREYRHLTQDELAEAVGCSKASIGHWESGARRLTDKWLPALAKALSTSTGYILDHDPNDLPTDVLDVWASIPETEKPRALEILRAFRTGTDG